MIPRELIVKYFRNECSDAEKELVLEYFRNNPEEWNKYMTEEDWDNFEVSGEPDPELSDRLFKTVSRNSFKKGKRINIKTAWLAAAVSTGLVIGLLWMYQSGKRPSAAESGAPAAPGQMVERKNLSDTLMPVMLGDGSEVVLSPKSSIRFYEPFASAERRTVYLSGEALFKAAVDKARPFAVYADQLATTVLGTAFTVQSFVESSLIKVKVHEGKVQVAAADTVQTTWKHKVILLAGDELTYDRNTMLARITRNAPAEHMVKAGAANSKARTVQRPDWYTFDTSPLSDVFDQLSSYYQVDIYYYPSDIRDKYFSGKMRKADTLETILHDIALLNRLTIVKKDGSYIIRKEN